MSKFKSLAAGTIGTIAAVVPTVSVFAVEGSSSVASGGTSLSSVITADSISGVLSEITGLLPVILPTIIAFIAFRKGWAWFKSQIKGA